MEAFDRFARGRRINDITDDLCVTPGSMRRRHGPGDDGPRPEALRPKEADVGGEKLADRLF